MSLTAESLVSLGLLVLAGLVLFLALLTWYTTYVLTHPTRRTYASALARNRPGVPSELPPGPSGARTFESWTIHSQAGELPVWDIPGDNPSGPVMILSHGWGDSRIGGLTRVAALSPLASRLVLWDMPGHGDAPGTCSLGTREVSDLLTVLDRVGSPAVLFGWSLGAGVSIAAAAKNPEGVIAVVAEAPYRVPSTPAANVLRTFGLPNRINLPIALRLLGVRFGVGGRWVGFDRAELATRVVSPVLVLHGEEDDICPIEDGREIALAAGGTLLALAGTGHHGMWSDPATASRCTEAVAALLARLPSAPQRS